MTNEVQVDARAKLAALKAERSLAVATRKNNKEHIVLCIDKSGSMCSSWDGIQCVAAATDAAKAMVSASDANLTSYSVIPFDYEATLKVTNTTNYAEILVMQIYADGGTNFDAALSLALSVSPSRAVLLSDGYGYLGDNTLQKYINLGIKIDTIAIGDANDDALRAIAEKTGGTFTRANTPAELKSAFIALETRNYLRLEHK